MRWQLGIEQIRDMQVQQGLPTQLLQHGLDGAQLCLQHTARATDPDKSSCGQPVLQQTLQRQARH